MKTNEEMVTRLCQAFLTRNEMSHHKNQIFKDPVFISKEEMFPEFKTIVAFLVNLLTSNKEINWVSTFREFKKEFKRNWSDFDDKFQIDLEKLFLSVYLRSYFLKIQCLVLFPALENFHPQLDRTFGVFDESFWPTIDEEERVKLFHFRNLMHLAVNIFPQRYLTKKEFMVDVVARVCEGMAAKKYCRGGTKSDSTKCRYAIFTFVKGDPFSFSCPFLCVRMTMRLLFSLLCRPARIHSTFFLSFTWSHGCGCGYGCLLGVSLSPHFTLSSQSVFRFSSTSISDIF